MRSNRPERFVADALVVVLIGSLLTAVVLVGLATVDRYSLAPIDPHDDEVWLGTASVGVAPEVLYSMANQPLETVVGTLGPPLIVRHASPHIWPCKQAYVYAAQEADALTPVRLCIGSDRRVESVSAGRVRLDLWSFAWDSMSVADAAPWLYGSLALAVLFLARWSPLRHGKPR